MVSQISSRGHSLPVLVGNSLRNNSKDSWEVPRNFLSFSVSLLLSFLRTTSQISSVPFSLVIHSCPTLCDPMNRSRPGLPVHHQLPEFINYLYANFSLRSCFQRNPGYTIILLTWLTPSYTSDITWFMVGRIVALQSLSYVWFFATPWTTACQTSLSFTISQSMLKLI